MSTPRYFRYFQRLDFVTLTEFACGGWDVVRDKKSVGQLPGLVQLAGSQSAVLERLMRPNQGRVGSFNFIFRSSTL